MSSLINNRYPKSPVEFLISIFYNWSNFILLFFMVRFGHKMNVPFRMIGMIYSRQPKITFLIACHRGIARNSCGFVFYLCHLLMSNSHFRLIHTVGGAPVGDAVARSADAQRALSGRLLDHYAHCVRSG